MLTGRPPYDATDPREQLARAAARAPGEWRADPALAGVRDPAALEKLPADERAAWRRLWADAEPAAKRTAGVV